MIRDPARHFTVVEVRKASMQFMVCNMYASNNSHARAQVWEYLRNVLATKDPILVRDFNMVGEPRDRSHPRQNMC